MIFIIYSRCYLSALNFRWMGPRRYDVSGGKTWMCNKGYKGKISFTIDHTSTTNPKNLKYRCLNRCPTCEGVSEIIDKEDNENAENEEAKLENRSMIDTSLQEEASTVTIEGKFISVTGAVTSCMSPKSPKGITPSAHLGDGNIDLIVVNKTSRLNYLRYLIRTNMPTPNYSPFQLPFVNVYRVKEFTFSPSLEQKNGCNQEKSVEAPDTRKEEKTSVWNCDGEIICSPSISAKVYCQILPVFARGIE